MGTDAELSRARGRSKVADHDTVRSTLPPLVSRIPVSERVLEILSGDATKRQWHTIRGLAAQIYETDQPTPGQLSTTRRAVSRLVAGGRAVRDGGVQATASGAQRVALRQARYTNPGRVRVTLPGKPVG